MHKPFACPFACVFSAAIIACALIGPVRPARAQTPLPQAPASQGPIVQGPILQAPDTQTAIPHMRVSHFTLANGLELIIIPDHRTPVVTHMVWYKAGSADEPWGTSGIAHFLEHLMFKGTAKNPARVFSHAVAVFGGQENAFTTADYTAFYQRVPREDLKEMMAFEADRMTGLVLTDDVVLPERQVILEEQNQRIANNPSAKLSEEVEAALYLNHPYGKPVIGWRHEMEKLDRNDAIAFYHRFYTPNNAVVVVAGDIDPAEVKAMAEATYGKVAPRAAIGPRMRPQEPDPRSIREVTLPDPQVEQPSLQRNYLVPPYAKAKPGVAEALDVLAHILGSGSTSRLYRRLVVDKELAVNAGAYYQGTALDMTRFGVYAIPQQSVTLPQLATAIDGVITELANGGLEPGELERAKTRLIADAVYAQDNQTALARWYGAALTTGQTVEDVENWPDRIRNVSADDVRDAARMWLQKRRSVTGFLVKAPKPENRS